MLPIVRVVMPKDLDMQANGVLDPSLLVEVGPRGVLHHLAARAFKALQAECVKEGLPLTYTFGGCYRSYDNQKSLFLRRYAPAFIEDRSRKWWNNQWWYLRPGVAMAAVPGTSNHGWGLAIDTAFDTDPTDGLGPDDAASISGHPKFPWFRDVATKKYGFSFEAQSEPWHIRYVAGDAIPQAVLDFEKPIVDKAPVFDPANGQYSLWPVANKPAVKFGDRGDAVRYLQGVLKNRAGQDVGPIDGFYGKKTEDAVRNVQKFFKQTVDGWVGKRTWAVIDSLATSK